MCSANTRGQGHVGLFYETIHLKGPTTHWWTRRRLGSCDVVYGSTDILGLSSTILHIYVHLRWNFHGKFIFVTLTGPFTSWLGGRVPVLFVVTRRSAWIFVRFRCVDRSDAFVTSVPNETATKKIKTAIAGRRVGERGKKKKRKNRAN